jgi:hypothetical protein
MIHKTFQIFLFSLFPDVFFFSEKLMDCLYSDNILISTLPVNIKTIDIVTYF